ncbi:MAG: ATP-binding cassette domain-containing protein [Lentimicrobiaceae bacterium]|nr:ATP-binding cassette domain-containing protein [Lentimicrobiaceae bacterium]
MLRIERLSVDMGEFALQEMDMQVEQGDYFVVLGVSGAGKSLLLETIAGIVKPAGGHIYLNHEEITHHKIQDRGVGLVYQDHALFPHLTVQENIAYPLKSRSIERDQAETIMLDLASRMNITHLLHRKPGTLSGGEQQRVALARTLALDPSVLLLDEPLASLDVELKKDLRKLLRKINQDGMTILHVTHDYEEAITLANKVAVLHNGKIIQSGSITEVFQHPRNAFTASFIGIKNFFPAQLLPPTDMDGGSLRKALINNELCFFLQGQEHSDDGFLILRAEDVIIGRSRPDSSARNNFQGTILDISPCIQGFEITVNIGVHLLATITRDALSSLRLQEGEHIWVSFKASALKFIEG